MSSGGSEEHAECIYTQPPSKISVKNTTLLNWRDQTAANYVDDNTGSCCGAVDVENSLLGGGDYALYGGGNHVNCETYSTIASPERSTQTAPSSARAPAATTPPASPIQGTSGTTPAHPLPLNASASRTPTSGSTTERPACSHELTAAPQSRNTTPFDAQPRPASMTAECLRHAHMRPLTRHRHGRMCS